jgi:hypothetical protein
VSASTAALGAPAALAALGYLNARWRVSVDVELILSLVASQRALAKREAADRINSFYLIEEYAQNPKVADKIFIIYQEEKWTFKQTYNVSSHGAMLRQVPMLTAGRWPSAMQDIYTTLTTSCQAR